MYAKFDQRKVLFAEESLPDHMLVHLMQNYSIFHLMNLGVEAAAFKFAASFHTKNTSRSANSSLDFSVKRNSVLKM